VLLQGARLNEHLGWRSARPPVGIAAGPKKRPCQCGVVVDGGQPQFHRMRAQRILHVAIGGLDVLQTAYPDPKLPVTT